MKLKIPHTFTIVFIIVIVCAVMTWIIPGGEFERTMVPSDSGGERSIVVPGSYHAVDNAPQTWQIFTAFFKGFERTSYIIAFILMIGGAFWVVNHTKTIDIGIVSFLHSTQKLQRYKLFKFVGVNNCVITLIMILFSLFGAIFGMSEETIAFIAIFVPLSISMGYDSIVGVLMCSMAANIGFAGAIFNPFTLGIAQGLSGLPPYSGMGYRVLCWALLTFIIIAFTLWYAARIKKNPQKSIMYELDQYWRDRINPTETTDTAQPATTSTWIVYASISVILIISSILHPQTDLSIGDNTYQLPLLPILAGGYILLGFVAARRSVHHFIFNILLFTILILIVGVLGYHWYVMEIAGLFFAMGFAAGFAYNLHLDQIVRLYLDGFKDILTAALVVGIAGGIIVILEDGKIIDTILYAASQTMTGSGKEGALGAMYAIQNLLNIFIPSGSAKAALTIPMMAEFSDIVGISRQLTVLAFQFGDGFTNMLTPTSGVLIGCLGVAHIPYSKWVKFIWPLVIAFIILGFILLLPPIYLSITGF